MFLSRFNSFQLGLKSQFIRLILISAHFEHYWCLISAFSPREEQPWKKFDPSVPGEFKIHSRTSNKSRGSHASGGGTDQREGIFQHSQLPPIFKPPGINYCPRFDRIFMLLFWHWDNHTSLRCIFYQILKLEAQFEIQCWLIWHKLLRRFLILSQLESFQSWKIC